MSLKYSTTTADYLVWSDAMNLIRKLAKDGTIQSQLVGYYQTLSWIETRGDFTDL